MPGATPCRGYPYPLDTDLIDIAQNIKDLAERLDVDLCGIFADAERTPVGTLRTTIKESPDPGWALMGTTIVNAQTLNPEFWAIAPVAWRSGANIVLPSMADRMVTGGGTVGAVGGSNTRQITAANLPLHQHTIDHTHAASNTVGESNDHAHGVSIESSGVNYVTGQGILLRPSDPSFGFVVQKPGGGSGFTLNPNTQVIGTLPSTEAMPYVPPGPHTHSVNGATQGRNAGHTHGFATPGFSGQSGNGGFANAALDMRQAFLSVVYQIRVSP